MSKLDQFIELIYPHLERKFLQEDASGSAQLRRAVRFAGAIWLAALHKNSDLHIAFLNLQSANEQHTQVPNAPLFDGLYHEALEEISGIAGLDTDRAEQLFLLTGAGILDFLRENDKANTIRDSLYPAPETLQSELPLKFRSLILKRTEDAISKEDVQNAVERPIEEPSLMSRLIPWILLALAALAILYLINRGFAGSPGG